ncbi:conserved hypothetical protein [Xanthomonas citri pv. citri]|nr:conserved hypothetical protein [Xanthomonas citri pv. citri]
MSHLDYERGLYEGVAAQQHQYAEGRRDGWDEAIEEMTPRFQALERERDDLAYALKAVAATGAALMEAMRDAPPHVRIAAVNAYNDRCDDLIGSVLRCPPHLDPTVQEREPAVARWIPDISDQLVNSGQAIFPDDDPSP